MPLCIAMPMSVMKPNVDATDSSTLAIHIAATEPICGSGMFAIMIAARVAAARGCAAGVIGTGGADKSDGAADAPKHGKDHAQNGRSRAATVASSDDRNGGMAGSRPLHGRGPPRRSTDRSRWPEGAFEEGLRRVGPQPNVWRRSNRSMSRGQRAGGQRRGAHVVGHQMLRRLGRVVDVGRAVVVVVMALVLQVQRGVRDIRRREASRGREPRQRRCLPHQGKQHHEHDGAALHGQESKRRLMAGVSRVLAMTPGFCRLAR